MSDRRLRSPNGCAARLTCTGASPEVCAQCDGPVLFGWGKSPLKWLIEEEEKDDDEPTE